MIYHTLYSCFLHVINIAIKSGLVLLTNVPKKKKVLEDEKTSWESEDEDENMGTSADNFGEKFSTYCTYNCTIDTHPTVHCQKLVANH